MLTFVFAVSLAFAAFNEQYQGVDLRPAYAAFAARFGDRALAPEFDDVDSFMNRPLDDGTRLLPKPVVLAGRDYRLLQAGSLQRLHALTLFFTDVVEARKRPGLLDRVFTNPEMREAFQRHNRYSLTTLRTYYRRLALEDINVLAGSDVVRASDGRFLVMEDNFGVVGGFGDVLAALAFLGRQLGVDPTFEPPAVSATREFLRDLPRDRWSKVVVLDVFTRRPLPGANEGHGYRRVLEQLSALGLTVIGPDELLSRLTAIERGEITHLVNFADLLDLKLPITSRELLLDLFRTRRLRLFTPPGVGLLGRKSLLPHVERIIRVYLNEEPILRTIPTVVARTSARENSVYKTVDGKQGTGVHFGATLDPAGRAALSDEIEDPDGPGYVRQRFVDASFLPAEGQESWIRFNLDFRPLVSVVRGQPLARPPVWGRANFKFPGTRSNLKQGGFETVVVTPDLCAGLLTEPRAPEAPTRRGFTSRLTRVLRPF